MNKLFVALFTFFALALVSMAVYFYWLETGKYTKSVTPVYVDNTQVVTVEESGVSNLSKVIGIEDPNKEYEIKVYEEDFPTKSDLKTFQAFDESDTSKLAFGCNWEISEGKTVFNVYISRSEYEKWIPEGERQNLLNKALGFCFIEFGKATTGTNIAESIKSEIYNNVADKYQVLKF